MREFGGYLPLELPNTGEYYSEGNGYQIGRFNSGRTAILCSLSSLGVRRVFCPVYYCPSVIRAIKDAGYEVELYPVGFDLCPILRLSAITEHDSVIIVNYFGLYSSSLENWIGDVDCVIVDNALSFYTPPILRAGVVNIYSCRKFFGVSDGAYAVAESLSFPALEKDRSAGRVSHLVAAIEESTNSGYQDSLRNEAVLGSSRMEMSKLTRRILKSIDYEAVKKARSDNYRQLGEELSGIQELEIAKEPESPWCYPLLCNRSIREELVSRHVYVPRMWEAWIGVPASNTPEYVYSNFLVCLPIDQRYNMNDMTDLANTVKSVLEETDA